MHVHVLLYCAHRLGLGSSTIVESESTFLSLNLRDEIFILVIGDLCRLENFIGSRAITLLLAQDYHASSKCPEPEEDAVEALTTRINSECLDASGPYLHFSIKG